MTAALLASGCSSSYTPRSGRRLSMVLSGGQIAYVRDYLYDAINIYNDTVEAPTPYAPGPPGAAPPR